MKKIITLSLMITLGWAGTAFGQCTASATVSLTGNPGEVHIIDQSTTGSGATYSYAEFYKLPNYTYTGTVQLQPYTTSATFQFTSNGDYHYFVQVYDSISSCYDSITGTVTITGLTNTVNCDASYSYTTNSANQNEFFFTSTGNNNSGLFYYWNFDDGSTSNSPNPTHTFTNAGTYNVCLTVEDTASSCIDTVCQTITVGNPSVNCDAEFYIFQDSINSGQIYAWNLSNGNNISYTWDFGDGTTSNQQFPTHTFQSLGTYVICLTVYNNAGCNDTFCDSVVITTKASGTTFNVLDPFQSSSSIDEENKSNVQDVNLYPNPNDGSFALVFNSNEASTIGLQLTSLTGAVVLHKSVKVAAGENRLQFDQSNLANGIYVLNIRDNNSGDQEMIKMIKN